MPLNPQHRKPENPIRRNDRNHDPHPLPHAIGRVVIRIQHRRAADLAFRCQITRVHAVVFRGAGAGGAGVVSVCELVDLEEDREWLDGG
jgi:hypothetical protein